MQSSLERMLFISITTCVHHLAPCSRFYFGTSLVGDIPSIEKPLGTSTNIKSIATFVLSPPIVVGITNVGFEKNLPLPPTLASPYHHTKAPPFLPFPYYEDL